MFDTFVNQWCVKKDKNVFQLGFNFHALPEIPEMLESHAHKKFNFQCYRKITILRIIVSWSNLEISIAAKCSI